MIDLCVVNFNTGDKLDRLVQFLHEDLDVYGKCWRLYVMDNGSTDNTYEILNSYCVDHESWDGNKYQIEAVWSGYNIGYARACNRLALAGSGDIIGLLNADVWLRGRDVFMIQKIFDGNPDISILGPKQRNENGYITAGGIFGSLEAPVHRGWQEPDLSDLRYRDQVDAVTVAGSAYFIRRSAWEALTNCEVYQRSCEEFTGERAEGAFLPTPHYYEETFCSYHAHAHGLRVVYDGHVSIGHSWHASSAVGGEADQKFPASRQIFRAACVQHGIPHD